MGYLAEVKGAIERSHGGTAVYVGCVTVRIRVHDCVAWEGDVEVFDLEGNSKAKRAYGWGYPDEKSNNTLLFATVLAVPPVVSAEAAVRAFIARGARWGHWQAQPPKPLGGF